MLLQIYILEKAGTNMQIAICDDIQKELETIRAALDTYAEAHPELQFTIDECLTALKFPFREGAVKKCRRHIWISAGRRR